MSKFMIGVCIALRIAERRRILNLMYLFYFLKIFLTRFSDTGVRNGSIELVFSVQSLYVQKGCCVCGRNSSVGRVPDSRFILEGLGLNNRQERRENFLLQS